jgi:hypothetical protein
MDNHESVIRLPADASDFSLLQSIQTMFGPPPHPNQTSYSVDTGGYFLRVNQPERESERLYLVSGFRLSTAVLPALSQFFVAWAWTTLIL